MPFGTVRGVHDNAELVEERITRELAERVLPLVTAARQTLHVEAGPALDELAPFAVGRPWGKPWDTTWFRFSGSVPEDWAHAANRGRHRIEAMLDLGWGQPGPGFCWEGLVRDAGGHAVHGLHPRRQAVAVEPVAGPFSVDVEAASNPSFPQFQPSPLGSLATAGDDPQYVLARADVVLVDLAAEALLYDFAVLDEVMRTRPAHDQHRARTRRVLAGALDAVAAGAPPADVRRLLAAELARPAGAGTHRVVATGHAHIDTAWLWPTRETVRKCVRTFSSAVGLLDADPEHRFVASQAQQYEWVRQREPELFARIGEKVAAGQWIPVGGQWVEADMNLPSGESLVRQIVHGQRYFEEHFGVRCTEMWIPDVFGYPAGLPQLFRAGGMDRFVTQKLSWNRTNRFPHHTFWWEGLDGSRVLTHFPPVDTYGSELVPVELAGAVERFAEHAWSRWSLVPFGFGDGGGGPTREMLAYGHRCADLDGVPPVTFGAPSDFFAHVEAEAAAGAPVPVWRGELYFETHRGTLTSQLGTKLGNRRCERLLRECELWSTTAALAGRGDGDPHALDAIWREVLTQQFHDILPGSSIAWVHEDAEETFGRVAADLEQRIAATLGGLVPAGATVVANAAGVDRDEVIEVDGVARRVRVPALGLARLDPELPAGDHLSVAVAEQVVVTDRSMANGRLAVSWDLDGNLTSVIDVERGREVVPAGRRGAVLELAADRPVRYDAWDVESWTVEQGVPVGGLESVTIERSGPLVGVVAVRRTFGPSAATVRYVLRAGSPRLDVRDRPRLAPRRAPAVDGVPRRRAHRAGHVRRAVRGGAPADARLHLVGRRQVRGVRTPLRRHRRAGVRRRRARRRALRLRRPRPRRGQHRARQPGPGGEVPRPRRRPRSPRGDPVAVPARSRGSTRWWARPSASTCRCGWSTARTQRLRVTSAARAGAARQRERARGRRRQARRRRLGRPRRAPPRGGRGPTLGDARCPGTDRRGVGLQPARGASAQLRGVRRRPRPHRASVRAGDAAPHAGASAERRSLGRWCRNRSAVGPRERSVGGVGGGGSPLAGGTGELARRRQQLGAAQPLQILDRTKRAQRAE